MRATAGIAAAWMLAFVRAFVLVAATVPPALAADGASPPPAAEAPDAQAVLQLNGRRIATFRASLLGDTPAERATLARAALEAALARRGPGQITRTRTGEVVHFELDGHPLFYLLTEDVSGGRPGAMLDAAAEKVEMRLRIALNDAREIADPRMLALGAAYAAGATGVAWTAAWLLLALRRRGLGALVRRLDHWQRGHPQHKLMQAGVQYVIAAVRPVVTLLTWVLVLLLLDIWATFVLRQFAYTRPWGEQSTAWLIGVVEQFVLAAARAFPGLVTAALIFSLARLVSRAGSNILARVERGELHLGWLDTDTAGPTRRLGNVVIWLFALAMAYPYLPGADTDAFKGVSVLAGLMLSLGATGLVGQAMSGLSLMYARALRVGEYVRIGETEGTVTAIGLFATQLHTGLGEEVSLPHTVVFSQPVRNFSRLVRDGQFMLHTAVTIGYATPWRQVHAMLLEAARRTAGVKADPAPFVVQTALSDFYVEYRLCAQADRSAPRSRAEAMNRLHAHIQDVFNENGVQIMSPHYRGDPPQPQLVEPGDWFPDAGAPLRPPGAATPGRPTA